MPWPITPHEDKNNLLPDLFHALSNGKMHMDHQLQQPYITNNQGRWRVRLPRPRTWWRCRTSWTPRARRSPCGPPLGSRTGGASPSPATPSACRSQHCGTPSDRWCDQTRKPFLPNRARSRSIMHSVATYCEKKRLKWSTKWQDMFYNLRLLLNGRLTSSPTNLN